MNSRTATWEIVTLSGHNIGAKVQIANDTISIGNSFNDDVILDDEIGEKRIVIKAISRDVAKILVNGNKIRANNVYISEKSPRNVKLPCIINYGDGEFNISLAPDIKMSINANPNHSNRIGNLWGIISAVASFVILAGLGFLIFNFFKTNPDWRNMFVAKQANTELSQFNTQQADNNIKSLPADETKNQSVIENMKQQLQALGIGDAINIAPSDEGIVAVGRVNLNEVGAWQDLKNSLAKNGVNIIDKVSSESLEPQEVAPVETKRPQYSKPSLNGKVAAIDFMGGSVTLKSGQQIGLGQEIVDGWNLLRLNQTHMVLKKGAETVNINFSSLSN